MNLQVTKTNLIDKELDRIKRLDKISITFMPRECYEKPEVVRQTYIDNLIATQENKEAFMEVMSQL